jgi:hypothetical protein
MVPAEVRKSSPVGSMRDNIRTRPLVQMVTK